MTAAGGGCYSARLNSPDCIPTMTLKTEERPVLKSESTPGPHVVALRVSDDNVPARTDLATEVIHVENRPPFAEAGGPYVVSVGSALLEIDGSDSFDPDPGDAIISYEWDLDDDSEFDDAFGPFVTLNATDSANYPA